VATISRIDKIIGLFWRISSLWQGSFAKETYNLIDPTNQSHPISRWGVEDRLIVGARTCIYTWTWQHTMSHVCECLCLGMHVCLTNYLSIYLSIYLTNYLSIYLSIYLSFYLSIYLFFYYFMHSRMHTHVYVIWTYIDLSELMTDVSARRGMMLFRVVCLYIRACDRFLTHACEYNVGVIVLHCMHTCMNTHVCMLQAYKYTFPL